VAEKLKEVTVALSVDQIAWLDKQADRLSVSRAAYLRTLLALLSIDEPLHGLIENS
jgi:hypothetical protein